MIYSFCTDKKRSVVPGGEGGRPHRKLLMQYYSQDKSQVNNKLRDQKIDQ